MDASFWALVALIVFFGLLAYIGVPKIVSKNLDERADKIRSDLDEARRLREEAQSLLAEYQRKRKDAEAEADELVASARREADALARESERKTADYVARRTAMAEQKIAQAEGQAIAEVKARAVDVSVDAAARIIADRMAGSGSDDMFAKSLSEVKARMN